MTTRTEGSTRVCVIGAGAAGLCAARHALSRPELFSSVVVLEQAAQAGGTWVYSDAVGKDAFGLPVHTSMYKSLRTNLPKEIMGFPDFPIPPRRESYLPAKDLLAFLQLYSDQHGVTKHIKFNHHVKLVKPKENEIWEVTYTNLRTNETTMAEFDYVMVCNGHYSTPHVPRMPGLEHFTGRTLHSHDYRKPDTFAGARVLVVGAGPSGLDIALELCGTAQLVLLSHHLAETLRTRFPDNLRQKPDVSMLGGRTAHFVDGSAEEVDVVFFCTGYEYNFPFLDASCGVRVRDNCVEPLYKHMVNITHPSMCFIGIPFYVCAFSMFDLQVRYFVRSVDGSFSLPTREEMEKHRQEEFEDRASRGYHKRQTHMMGPDQETYYASLALEAGTETLPSVLTKIREESSARFLHDLQNYRRDVYRVIDRDRYEVVSGALARSG